MAASLKKTAQSLDNFSQLLQLKKQMREEKQKARKIFSPDSFGLDGLSGG